MSDDPPRLPSFAKQLIDEPEPLGITQVIPDDWTIPQIAEAVVRGKIKLPSQQQQMLKELLPFVLPKKSAVAVTTFEGGFGPALDRCIERSGKGPELRLIEGSKSDDKVSNE
jgi:hypothetical protein